MGNSWEPAAKSILEMLTFHLSRVSSFLGLIRYVCVCVKDWTDGIDIVAAKWQDVAEECRFTAFSDPAEGLNASHV